MTQRLLCFASLLMVFIIMPPLINGIESADESTEMSANADVKRQPNWNDRLRRDLLTTYKKFARNVKDSQVILKLGLTVQHLELDETNSIFSTFGWVHMQWNDPKLRWSPDNYGNITRLHVGDKEIWLPDILIYNSPTGENIEYYGSSLCVVTPDGTVDWKPPSQLQSHCNLDLRYWPFDEQTCSIKMGSWTYDGDELNLTLMSDKVDVDLSVENAEWTLKQASETKLHVIMYFCCPEPYIDVEYTFYLLRQSDFYGALIVTPATVVVLLMLVSFWLPAGAVEKVLLNGVNVLICVSFLLYFWQCIAKMAEHTPYVVRFFSNALYMTAFSIIVSVGLLNVCHSQQSRLVPIPVRIALDGWLGQMLLLRWLRMDVSAVRSKKTQLSQRSDRNEHNAADIIDSFDGGHAEDHRIIQTNYGSETGNRSLGAGVDVSPNVNQLYWILLATAIDRTMFLLYAFVFVIMASVYAV